MRCTHYKSSTPALRWKKQNKTKQNKINQKNKNNNSNKKIKERQKHKRREKESLTIFDGFTLDTNERTDKRGIHESS